MMMVVEAGSAIGEGGREGGREGAFDNTSERH